MFNALGQCAEYIGGNPNTGRDTGGIIGKILRDDLPGVKGVYGAGDAVGNAPGDGSDATSLVSGSSINAMTVNAGAPDLPIDMRDWLKPMTRIGSVSGVNAFPRNTIIRDPYQYGFRGFDGMGFGPDLFPADPVPTVPYRVPSPPSGSVLEDILRTIQVTLPATISAIKGRPYYNPAQNIPAVAGAYGTPGYAGGAPGANIGATAGAAVGNIGDAISQIVQQHPMLVLAAGVGLVLLFVKPPSRRR